MAAGAELLSTPKKVLEYRYLHVDVQDTGIGIKALDVPRLFYKFVQADSTTTRNFGGTGLGLAISRKFVEVFSKFYFISVLTVSFTASDTTSVSFSTRFSQQ